MLAQRVWLPRDGLWVSALRLDDTDRSNEIRLRVEDECDVVTVPSSTELPRRNEDGQDSPADLASLAHLDPPSVIHALAERFKLEEIYTWTGSVLIALNPWKSLPQLYSAGALESFRPDRAARTDETTAPHPFAIAAAAFKGLKRGKRQSVLVSGESGAGKTETTKVVLQFFSALSGDTKGDAVQRVLLECNPVLEAFGNAKTLRNNNSSRFGKWVEVHLDASGAIIGGSVSTYLLEKSRIAFQPASERNFHIFYEMLSHGAGVIGAAAGLALPEPAEVCYLNGGSCLNVDDVDDAKACEELESALSTLGLDGTSLRALARALLASMMLGNVRFGTAQGEEHAAVATGASSAALAYVADALALTAEALEKALTSRRLDIRGDCMIAPRTPEQAGSARDAIAKAIYGALFQWLVRRINERLRCIGEGLGEGSAAAHGDDARVVGILDIFGFEHFKHNSFEQLCINFANEKLQAQFNGVVFEQQQLEYEAEGIGWEHVAHAGNGAPLELLEGKLGVLDLLREQCRLPNGADHIFCESLREKHQGTEALHAPPARPSLFGVRHYAGLVLYESSGFLEKNRDLLPECARALLRSSHCGFIKELLPAEGCGGGGSSADASLAGQFRSQLHALLSTVALGDSHHVRCVTPNPKKQPGLVDMACLHQQLVCGGVMEAVRVARAGYPHRVPHVQFAARFRCLAVLEGAHLPPFSADAPSSVALPLSKILERTFQTGCIVLGKTKVFLKKETLETLEDRRGKLSRAMATRVQALVRMAAARSEWRLVSSNCLLLQRVGRGAICRASLRSESRRLAAKAATLIQAAAHGRRARRRIRAYRDMHRAATLLAAAWRGLEARRAHATSLIGAIALQCALRSRAARSLARRIQGEQQDAEKLREEKGHLAQQLRQQDAQLAQMRAELQANDKASKDGSSVQRGNENDAPQSSPNTVHSQLSRVWTALAPAGQSGQKLDTAPAKPTGSAEALAEALAEMQQLREKVQSLQEDLRETQLCEKTNAATAQPLDQQILHLEKERSQLKLQLADAQLQLADAQLHIADAREEAQKEASKCVRQEKLVKRLVKDLAEAKLCASKFR